KPTATATPGTRTSELMPRLARQSERFALIRSMTHRQPEHTRANTMMLSGQTQPERDAPALGSIVAKLRSATRNVPSYVWLQKFAGGAMPADHGSLSGGFLGANYAPLAVGTKDHTQDPSRKDFRVTVLDSPDNLPGERIRDRLGLLGQLDTSPIAAGSGLDVYRERALDIVTGPAARRAFDLTREPDRVRDAYGRHPLGQHLLLTRRLVEAGGRLVGVVGWCGLAPGDKFLSVETWDMHGSGTPIFGTGWNSLGWAAPRLDEALPALLDDLSLRGLLDSTLVVAVGEFGRTPKIDAGGKGRNHW